MMSDEFNSLKLVAECPVCHKKQFPADITMVDEKVEGQIIHVKCKVCQSCVLVYVSFAEQGMRVIGVLTDLSSDEVSKFNQAGPLNVDDVIVINKLINNNFTRQLIDKKV